MNERADIELLMLRIYEMREAQRLYFNNKNDVNLKYSKAREKVVDDLLKQFVRKGYDMNRFKNNTEQGSMFY